MFGFILKKTQLNGRQAMSWCKLPLMIAVMATVQSCGSVAPESQVQGYTVPMSKVWPGGVVPVCWENPTPENADWRGDIVATIEKAYAPISTIHFEGWDACKPSEPGLHIQIYDGDRSQNGGNIFSRLFGGSGAGHPRVRALGTAVSGLSNGMILNPTLKDIAPGLAKMAANLTPDALINMGHAIAIHEMGHVLGLMHEQGRSDSLCPVSLLSRVVPGVPVGPYDADSIMNYCKARSQNYSIPMTLSPGDIATLQSLYPETSR